MAAGKPNDTRKANRRGAARLAAVQALYQMDVAGTPINEILAQFESYWIGREVEGEQTQDLRCRVLVRLSAVHQEGRGKGPHEGRGRRDHLLAHRAHAREPEEGDRRGARLRDLYAEAPRFQPKAKLITGVVCGVRVEDIEDKTMRRLRYLDKLIDELAKGKTMDKILRTQE